MIYLILVIIWIILNITIKIIKGILYPIILIDIETNKRNKRKSAENIPVIEI